eukprot:m.118705 g.118705  ORF g.118705 m.118705 type:complete len:190 (+) comp37659_c0_seq2:61-630(+)
MKKAVASLLFTVIIPSICGKFSGNYSLPLCWKGVCVKPCANLSNELDYVELWTHGWPNESVATVGLTLQPRKTLTDLKIVLKYEFTLRQGPTRTGGRAFGVCHGYGPAIEGLRCPIVAKERSTAKITFSSEDAKFFYDIGKKFKASWATVKLSDFQNSKNLLLCLEIEISNEPQFQSSPEFIQETETFH